jgi:hypothetical protein
MIKIEALIPLESGDKVLGLMHGETQHSQYVALGATATPVQVSEQTI